MNDSCNAGKMKGCGGRLCIACRPLLKRFTLYRYPLNAVGSPELGQVPDEYTVCGFTASVNGANIKDKFELPGKTNGGIGGLRMTIIGQTCDAVQKGDRIEVSGEQYRVAVVQRGTPSVAVLIPTGSGGAD